MSRFSDFIDKLHRCSANVCLEGVGFTNTYADLLNEIHRWQVRFDDMNPPRGCVIGIRSDYSLSAIGALLALFGRGGIAALIPRDRDTSGYLEDARASALLDIDVAGSYEFHPVLQCSSHPLIDRLRSTNAAGIVIFTSGSTGRPKAALQSLDGFLHKFTRPGRRMRTLAFLLLDHIAGLDTMFYTLSNGGTLVLTRRRDPRSILELIDSHRVEVLPASPSFLRLLCLSGLERQHNVSTLKIITYGSEPMDPDTLSRLTRDFPHVQVSQKYGTTETGSPRTLSRGNDSLWLKIKDDDVDIKVENGVLWIRGEGTMLGYLNETSPVDDEGWYCTGDLVDVDGEWIKFRGRATELINVGGEKVTPTEVERAILELDFVREALVSGEPHPLMGQVVRAQVELTNTDLGHREALFRIRSHCRAWLAPHKVPVRIDILSHSSLSTERFKKNRNQNSSNGHC